MPLKGHGPWPFLPSQRGPNLQLIEREIAIEEGDECVIAPLGDIQFDGYPEHIAGTHLKQHIARALRKKALFVGTGDPIDMMSPSNRQRLANAALYDNTVTAIQDKARELTDALYEEYLAPTEGQWLGLVEGHHYTDMGTDGTTDQYLARLLGTQHLGTCAIISLRFRGPKGRSGRVFLFVHHGTGSGGPGHVFRKLARLAGHFHADFLIQGHTTTRGVMPIPQLRGEFSDGRYKLRDRTVWLVSAGGWSRAYIEGSKRGDKPEGGYVERGAMAPVTLGAPFLTIIPRWGYKRAFEPELRAEA